MAKASTPMHIPPADIKPQHFTFEIPPSPHKTIVHIEVEVYQGEGSAMIMMEPLLGDGLVPPDKLRWAGQQHSLDTKSWKLLHLLVQTFEKRLPIDKVYSALWPGGAASVENLKAVQKRLNKRLDEIGKSTKVDFFGCIRLKANWVLLE